VAASLPLPNGLPVDTPSWKQTLVVVQPLVIHLLAVIRQQEEQIKTLGARGQRNSSNADRPPSSDPPWVKSKIPSQPKGPPGVKAGHPGHRQVLLEPTEVIEARPPACGCGQTAFPDTRPYYTHQVIELPDIQMIVRHFVLYVARCSWCGRVTKAAVPAVASPGYGPRFTALLGELSGSQRSSRSAVREFCQSVLGVPISQGAIQRAVDRGSEALKPHYEAIAVQAQRAPVHYIKLTMP
jgi:transposase